MLRFADDIVILTGGKDELMAVLEGMKDQIYHENQQGAPGKLVFNSE